MKIIRVIAAALLCLLLATPGLAGNSSTSFTPTVQNLSYSTGNSLGGLLSVNFFRFNATYDGVLDVVLLASQGGSVVPVTFYIFDKLPTASTCADRTAFVLGTVDVDKLAVAPFTLTPAAPTGTAISFAQYAQTISIRNKDTQPNAFIYVCMVAGGTGTPASVSDLVLKFFGAF